MEPNKPSEAPTTKLKRNLVKPFGFKGDENPLYPDDDDRVKLSKPTSSEISKIIQGKDSVDEEQAMSNLKNATSRFKAMFENSPLEAPVAGFNRHVRDMSPATRDMVLKSKMPDIMAFAEDRKIDPGIVAGVAEASMRLGRIPDLGMYGLAGDEALAVKDFIKDSVLNLAEQLAKEELPIQEDDENHPKAKHLKLAGDYKKLAEFHKRRAKEESDKARIAKDDGKTHSSIRANAASEEHKALASHCSGLADYHQLKANEHPAADASKPPAYPAQDPKKTPEEPPQNEKEHKAPMKDPGQKTEEFSGATSKFNKLRGKPAVSEQTTHASMASTVKPVGKPINLDRKTKAFPERANSILPMLSREPAKAPYFDLNRFGGDKKKLSGKQLSGQGYRTDSPSDAAELPTDKRPAMESGAFRSEQLLDDILTEAKKAKATKKKEAGKSKVKHVLANAKVAPLFQALGHKMDQAEAKYTGTKKKAKWCKDLHSKCLKQGGSVASDEVIKHSLNNPWVREHGFTDEASNLRKAWETAMSDDAHHHASTNSPTAPEPVVFAVNNMLRMSSK